MKAAYVDTSCLVAIALDEPGAGALAERLVAHDQLFSSNLLEAELRSALVREGIAEGGDDLLSWITWVMPNRPLSDELRQVMAQGRLKGADLWHLACALFLAKDSRELVLESLDKRQLTVGAALGFRSSGDGGAS